MSHHINEFIYQKMQRREMLGSLASMVLGGLVATSTPPTTWASQATKSPVNHDLYMAFHPEHALSDIPDEFLYVPHGYHVQRIISWADQFKNGVTLPLPIHHSQQQMEAFGYNNDFIAYHPLPSADGCLRALLSVNHEYTCSSLMFPDVWKDKKYPMSDEYMRIEMASVGHSVIEVKRSAPRGQKGQWEVQWNSPFQRRIHALGPVMSLQGPVAGHARVKTAQDPSGTQVIGTFSNCAGGQTPWGTTLIAEENVNQHFYVDLEQHQDASLLKRYGYREKSRRSAWHKIDDRFDLHKTPNEANRFGWVVELDPYHPQQAPVKRSALGRFKHECATCVINADQRVVVYSADDQINEYLYRYVSRDRYQAGQKGLKAHGHLLDHGTLQVAVFQADGTLIWKDLVFGQGPLTTDNQFYSQADVLIETRRAADLLGATALDRPEDVAVDPKSGDVYVMCTQHKDRTVITPTSPMAPNLHGHILKIIPHAGDHTHVQARWDVFLLGGPEGKKTFKTLIRNPDNGAFDPQGDLWITADVYSRDRPPFANGLWRYRLHGEHKGSLERFCSTPIGSEPCGPCFTPDGKTLFVAIQHPGEGSQWHTPSTRWPDFRSDRPPRPTVIAIERDDGDII